MMRGVTIALLSFSLAWTVPPLPLASPATGPFAYVTNFMSDTVSVIDTATQTVVATIPVGSRPIGVAVSPDGSWVYVANYAGGTVSVIDTAANAVIATVSLASSFPIGIAISPDGSRVYVTHETTGAVSVINTATNAVIATISVGIPGDDLTGIAVNPSGTRAYVVHSQTFQVSVIDTSTNTVITTIPVGVFPVGVAVHPSGQWVYVANQGSNDVSVIDATTNTVAATVAVGSGPTGIVVNPSGSRVYVTNQGNNTVSVINAATNALVTTIPVGTAPFGVSVTPDGSRVYVVNRGSNNVSVINAATNTVIATVSVGNSPVAFGLFIGPASSPPEANLRIQKTAPASVNIAQPFTYVIEVRNLGPSDAADVTVSDPVPEGVMVTGISGAGWTCGVNADVITCSRPSLPAGASAPPIVISARAPASGGLVLNTATVSSAVTDPIMSNNTSTAETELINHGLATFAIRSSSEVASLTYSTGHYVDGVLVVTSAEDQVRVFHNRGDGSFFLKQRISVGRGPAAIGVGDLTGDGITDAVTANLIERSLTILQGQEDGTFRRKVRTLSVEGQPWALALADFDRDGRLDLVLAYGDKGHVQVLKGRGDGTFRTGHRYPIGSRPSSLAVADMNKDGWLDVIVANSGSKSLTLLFGRESGRFAVANVDLGESPSRVAVEDLDEDGQLEIVVTHYREARLSIVRLKSRGESQQVWTAQRAVTMLTAEGPIGVAFGRFSSDAVGIACAGAIAEELWIYGSDGRGTLSLRQRLVTATPVSIVTGDVNGDGRQDLILLENAGERLGVWLSTEDGHLQRKR